MSHSNRQGFLAVPSVGQGPGVLVLHAWWGLNDTVKAVCSRLAEAGYVAYAPDLYHGRIAATIPEAEALGRALDGDQAQAQADLAAAVQYLDARARPGGLAVVGFSLGAFYALGLAAAVPEHIRAVVLFYGTGSDDCGQSQAAYLGHFAEADPFEPQANVQHLAEALRRAGRPVAFHQYPGTGHWFFEPDRQDAYNREAAALAWERTLAFLGEALPSGPHKAG